MRYSISCDRDYQPLVERWAPLMEIKPPPKADPDAEYDMVQIARLNHTGRMHILHVRYGMPHETGTALARCGVTGWFDDSKYLTPNAAALDKNRSRICYKCFAHMQRERRAKYDE